uniref:Polypeptide N-acetylgalactosaminyltransferase n=2 Tax=Ixodes ricinus TaxID=34613 RepID=V5H3Z4_IXORI
MKLMNFRRSRLIKLILVGVLVIFGVTFFLPKPTGIETQYQKRKKAAPLPVFKDKVLGNFEPAVADVVDKRKPGEGGFPYHTPPKLKNNVAHSNMEYGMNVVASDHISPNRTIPDMRLQECKYWDYPTDLPTTSVVVVFHNEGLSVLMRTVHSVINRSPRQFLKEVVLVDDYSDKENLKGELETYIARNFPAGLVRLLRNEERQGLIRSRSYGAEQSVGDVVLFLDAHCEVGINWLPPLLAPIRANRYTMTVPVIDGIDKDTFEYRPVYHGGQHFRGIFEWGMLYKEIEIPEEEIKRRKHHSEPYKSPTHAGGLFAIDREYFLKLGGYDPGLLVWGGENFELSFKIWQCGGSIYWVPCSRVGHVYRGFMPYSFGKLAHKRKGPIVTVNYKRVVEVWMDEYKEHLYHRRPHYRHLDPGDLTAQKALRKRLNCKSFKWFMEQVAFDQPSKYPAVEPPDYAWGEVRNEESGLCIDTQFKGQNERFSLAPCLKDQRGRSGEQQLVLTWHKDVRPAKRSVCFDVSSSDVHAPVMLWSCHGMHGNQLWKYDTVTKHLFHPITANCLDCDAKSHEVFMSICDSDVRTQRWLFEHVNETALANW